MARLTTKAKNPTVTKAAKESTTVKTVTKAKATTARVLVVDDSPSLRMMIVKALKKRGYQIVGEAGTSSEALKLYRRYKPEVVIKDLYMPDDDDGVTTIRTMLAINNKSKIIICSTFEERSMIISALRAGAHDYLLKPFEDKQVCRVVDNAIKQ